MSEKLPVISGKDVVKALNKVGYEVVRQKGSHLRLKALYESGRKPITVPLHNPVKRGLLRQIIKDANLSVQEFLKLL